MRLACGPTLFFRIAPQPFVVRRAGPILLRREGASVEYLPVTSARMIVDGLSAALTAALLMALARPDGSSTQQRKRAVLLASMWTHLACTLFDLVAAAFEGRTGAYAYLLVGAGVLLSRLLEIVTGVTIMNYVYSDAVGQPIDNHPTTGIVRFLLAVNGANAALLLSNHVTHVYYVHTAENRIVPGRMPQLGTALLLVQALVMAVVVVGLLNKMHRTTAQRFFACGLFSTVGIALDMYYPQLSLLYPTVCLVLVLIATGVQARLEEDLARARAETAESRVRLLSGQIHPHFVFNSLAAIKALVIEDPQQAELTLQDFSDYLRSHLDEMSTTRLVPFTVELDHVRHYVSLEMADTPVPLEVRYNLEADDFMLPPLTVQPLVENAIRHGIRTRESGGTVVVSSRRTGEGIEVSVSDDGHGFSSATERQEQRSRVGIANVRERIERQCDGSLVVRSTPEGTTVVLTIPEKDRA